MLSVPSNSGGLGDEASLFVSISQPSRPNAFPAPSSSEPQVQDVWICEKVSKSGTDIFGFLLLSGFGPSPKLIVDFVGRRLLASILESAHLEELAQRTGESRSWSGRREREEQVGRLLKEAFVRIDDWAYEFIQERLLAGEREPGRAPRARHWLASGCNAILALLLGSRLIVANCGSQMAIFCKNGTDGLSAISLSECQDRAAHCFGNFERKMPGTECTASARPTVHPQIELDHTAHFLLFASPQVWRLFQQVCPENQSLEGAIANAVAKAISGQGSPEQGVHSLLAQLLQKSSGPLPAGQAISLALIDLRLDIFPKMDFSGNEQEEAEGEGEEEQDEGGEGGGTGMVRSAVDWSEFGTHHLKEEVLAKVDSLRQLYRHRRNLDSIHEDL